MKRDLIVVAILAALTGTIGMLLYRCKGDQPAPSGLPSAGTSLQDSASIVPGSARTNPDNLEPEQVSFPVEASPAAKPTAAASEGRGVVARGDAVALWRTGKGPFPYPCCDELSDEEILRGLQDLRGDDGGAPEQRFRGLPSISSAIERGMIFAAVPILRDKFTQWRDLRQKLFVGSTLAWLGDFMAVPFAERIFAESEDAQTRVYALHVLYYARSLTDLVALRAGEKKHEMVAQSLSSLIPEREREEVEFVHQFGKSAAATSLEDLHSFSRQPGSVPRALILSEIYGREKK